MDQPDQAGFRIGLHSLGASVHAQGLPGQRDLGRDATPVGRRELEAQASRDMLIWRGILRYRFSDARNHCRWLHRRSETRAKNDDIGRLDDRRRERLLAGTIEESGDDPAPFAFAHIAFVRQILPLPRDHHHSENCDWSVAVIDDGECRSVGNVGHHARHELVRRIGLVDQGVYEGSLVEKRIICSHAGYQKRAERYGDRKQILEGEAMP